MAFDSLRSKWFSGSGQPDNTTPPIDTSPVDIKAMGRPQQELIVPADYLKGTVTPADAIGAWSRTPSGNYKTQLMRRAVACSTITTYTSMNSDMFASFPLRMYTKSNASSKAKGNFKVVSRSIESKKHISKLKDWQQVGQKAAYYADRSGLISEIVEHPFLDLYRNPNPMPSMTGFNFWRLSFHQRQIVGNTFIEIVRGNDGLPKELWLCVSQYVTVVPSKDYLIEGYRYQRPCAEVVTYDTDDILHLKYRESMHNPYEGSGWVEGIIPEADLLIQANGMESARFQNGCRIDFAVLAPDLFPNQVQQMKDGLNAEHRGTNAAGKFVVLSGATNIMPLNMTNKDMQYRDGQIQWAKSIRAAAGVTEAQADLNQSNLASAQMADTQYLRQTVRPALIAHAEQLTKFMQASYGHQEGDYWLAYEDVVPADKKYEADLTLSLWEANVLSLNEMRLANGYDADPEVGNQRYSDLLAASTAKVAPPTPVPPTPLATVPATSNPTEPPPKPPTPTAVPAPTPKSRKKRPMGIKSFSFDSNAYSMFLNNVTKWVSDGAKTGEYDKDQLLKALNPLDGIFRMGGVEGLNSLDTVAGGAKLIADSGVSFDIIPANALKHLDTYKIQLATSLTDERQTALKDSIVAAMKEGQDTKAATENVLQALQDRTQFDAERIARTESSRAYSQGALQSWKEAGVKSKRWLLSSSACAVCLAAGEMYNEAIPLEDNFFDKGDSLDVGDGQSVTFDYSAIDSPPLHPQCTCSIVPVVD